MIRWSVNSDKEQIENLINLCFGNREIEGAYTNIEGRYLLMFEKDNLIAMTGIVRNSMLGCNALEISWTCTHPEHRNKGYMTRLFSNLLPCLSEDVYCSCWRLQHKDRIELHYIMDLFNFECVLKEHVKREYPHKCGVADTCPNFKGNNCYCSEDLYIHRHRKG